MGARSKFFDPGRIRSFFAAWDGSASSGSAKFPPKIPIFTFESKIGSKNSRVKAGSEV